jgi:hypothetical protein
MSQSTLESPAGSLATSRSASRVPSRARLSPDSLGFSGASRGKGGKRKPASKRSRSLSKADWGGTHHCMQLVNGARDLLLGRQRG